MSDSSRNEKRSFSEKLASRVRDAFTRNPVVEARRDKRRRRVLTDTFIGSPEYEREIKAGFDADRDGLDSAELQTPNFRHRHHRKNDVLGAWRWLGLFERRDVVRPWVFSEQKRGVDVGGARGPISMHVDICDRLDRDIFGRPVRFHDLDEIDDETLDYAWSSHTFEHLPDLDGFVGRLSTKFKQGGKLFALVPAYTCRRWRAGVHQYADVKGDSSHLYTFYLSSDDSVVTDDTFCAIDELVGRHLSVEEAAMVGDNSIFIHATRR